MPKAFGAIRNANNIVLGNKPSPWDESFEWSFDAADSGFPTLIDLLKSFGSPIAPTKADFEYRLNPLRIRDEERDLLAECLASLVARSPNFRHRIRNTITRYRGEFGLREGGPDESLVALSVRNAQQIISQSMRRGKFVVLHSGEGEFIFGDGFFHNISSLSTSPPNPRCLVPLTPEIAVFYVSPPQYRSYPRAFSLNLTSEEVSFVNETVQVYSARFIFFREIYPVLIEAFRSGEHLQYRHHKHPWLSSLEVVVAEAFFGDDSNFYTED